MFAKSKANQYIRVVMQEEFNRSRILLGDNAMERLSSARVIVFGIGGVGSWAAETLVRTGLCHLSIVDFDTVSPSNINRQAPATASTVGCPKVEIMRRRLLDINPSAEIVAINGLFSPDTASLYDFNDYDYVIDAIDSLRDKVLLINQATRSRCKLFSSMGAALKTDPTRIEVAEFWKAKGDRLAAALRRRFKREGVFPAKKFKVVYSTEIVENRQKSDESISSDSPIRKPTVNGSLMQVTAPVGITLASLVINDLAKS